MSGFWLGLGSGSGLGLGLGFELGLGLAFGLANQAAEDDRRDNDDKGGQRARLGDRVLLHIGRRLAATEDARDSPGYGEG